eukprot:9236443-Alexandrium_andersonii.AAC.1
MPVSWLWLQASPAAGLPRTAAGVALSRGRQLVSGEVCQPAVLADWRWGVGPFAKLQDLHTGYA